MYNHFTPPITIRSCLPCSPCTNHLAPPSTNHLPSSSANYQTSLPTLSTCRHILQTTDNTFFKTPPFMSYTPITFMFNEPPIFMLIKAFTFVFHKLSIFIFSRPLILLDHTSSLFTFNKLMLYEPHSVMFYKPQILTFSKHTSSCSKSVFMFYKPSVFMF